MGDTAPPSPIIIAERKNAMKSNAKKLTKDKIEYLHILHAGWSTASYYSRLFGIYSWESPTEIPVNLIEKDGITILRFAFHSFDILPEKYSLEETREIMQQYLQYCILPSDKILRPYMGGSTIYDIVEPLYIDRVEESKGIWRIDIVYVDNPLAYKYIVERTWKGDMIL